MKRSLPVLIYQKIGHPSKTSHFKNQWVSPRKLEKTLAFLLKHHYTCITPLHLPKKLPGKPVLLTFLGGYQSYYTEVFPLLKKYKVQATVFVNTDTLGAYNRWQDPHREPWQNILTASQLKEMYQSGLIQVGVLGLSGKNLLEYDNASQAQEDFLEALHRLKSLYKIDACAVGFWPQTKDKNLVHTREICTEISLPVVTPAKGFNCPEEKQFLRVLQPGILTKFLLWKHH